MLRYAVLGVAFLLFVTASGAAAEAAWLDAPPARWNTPGAPVPQASPIHNPDLRCRTREVVPTTPEQSALADKGWRLNDFWPPVSSRGRVLIAALAEYDGMCRPFDYNVFVFSDGQYAGTLSPVNMNSRFDGSLFVRLSRQVAEIGPSGTIAAQFIRYADTDPLCCPSRGISRVMYTVQSSASGPVVVPMTITAAPAQAPAGLPATGFTPDLLLPLPLAAAGFSLVAVGLAARRRRQG
jgi:LppP/LprE lipoprotein